jgi:hypothetical protein
VIEKKKKRGLLSIKEIETWQKPVAPTEKKKKIYATQDQNKAVTSFCSKPTHGGERSGRKQRRFEVRVKPERFFGRMEACTFFPRMRKTSQGRGIRRKIRRTSTVTPVEKIFSF